MMDLTDLETALSSLLKGKHSSLTISYRDVAAMNYQTVAEYVSDFVSEDERQKAIDTDRVWTVHWYPDTPVGFYAVSASTLTAAVNAALDNLPADRKVDD